MNLVQRATHTQLVSPLLLWILGCYVTVLSGSVYDQFTQSHRWRFLKASLWNLVSGPTKSCVHVKKQQKMSLIYLFLYVSM